MSKMIQKTGVRALVLAAVMPLVVLLVGCGGGSRPPVVIVQQGPLGAPAQTPLPTVLPAPIPTPTTGPLPGLSADATPVIAGAQGQALDATMRRWIATQPAFHGTVQVSRGNNIYYSMAFGYADAASQLPMRPDAVWDWCSVSKQFGAAAVLKLQMMGRLRIDDPFSRYYPMPADKAAITIRQMLSHTSGLAQYEGDDATREATLAAMVALPLEFQPGTSWKYNNVNYTLMAAMIDRISGMRYEDFVRTYLLKPAGITGITFLGEPDVDASRVPKDLDGTGMQFRYGTTMPHWWRGAAGMMMTMRPLLQWDQALRTNAVLDDASKAELYRVVSNGYALGWFIDQANGETIISHDGAQINISTMFYRAQGSDIVVCVATSRDNPALYDLCKTLHACGLGLAAPTAHMDETGPRFQSNQQARARAQAGSR